ncbi:MAG TPA: nucleotide pyrophosphohydrolase [Candidatus Thermoplasmatota archaeon]|nr:nucleotide pyrophosphohydrolase [Candidatus Thermoplasmatota archaeon]
MPSPSFDEVRADLRAFVAERDWDQFHSPKDLALGLAVEAGELLQEFQWRDPSAGELRGDAARLAAVKAETADVVLYAMLLADKLGFDLLEACREKLAANRAKYPVERARGSAAKYTEWEPKES